MSVDAKDLNFYIKHTLLLLQNPFDSNWKARKALSGQAYQYKLSVVLQWINDQPAGTR